jgi:hypothetical protein
MLIKLLNFCCEIAALPRRFKAAVVMLFLVVLFGAFVLAALDLIQVEGFWKIKMAALCIYFLIIGLMYRRIRVKWHKGEFHFDECDNY